MSKNTEKATVLAIPRIKPMTASVSMEYMKRMIHTAGGQQIEENEDLICTPINRITKLTAMITPKIAQKLIEMTSAAVQRRQDKRTAENYALQMSAGEWQYNHQVVLQDTDGNVFDGLHRLNACVASGVPFITDMVKGADYATCMSTIDINRPRTRANIFEIALSGNYGYFAHLAATIGFLRSFSVGKIVNNPSKKDALTNQDLSWLASNQVSLIEDVFECVAEHQKLSSSNRKLIPAKLFAGLKYILMSIDPEKATEFFHKLGTGENLSADSPIMYIRTKLSDSAGLRNDSKAKLKLRDQLLYMVRAWNDFYSNDQKMSRSSYQINNVAMPKIEGLSKDAKFIFIPRDSQ